MAARVVPLAGEKQRGESRKAVTACNDWLRLGYGRSLTGLLVKYAKMHRNAPGSAPTRSRHTLKRWSAKFDWAGRAEQYDARQEAERNALRRQVMASGLAQDFARVIALRRLAALLEGELYHEEADGSLPNLWIPDVKQIGAGKNAERVDIVRFNRNLVDAYRSALDDIAKETGGRKLLQEVSGSMKLEQSRVMIVKLPDNERGDGGMKHRDGEQVGDGAQPDAEQNDGGEQSQ